MVECCEFPDERKEEEITSLFKNQDAMIKKNYRPITILTSESKIFERILHDQIKVFFLFHVIYVVFVRAIALNTLYLGLS